VQQVGRPARHADAAERDRRRQLAGRLVRSGDRASSTSSPTPASPISASSPAASSRTCATSVARRRIRRTRRRRR
jgi:hypothetical protein